MSDTAFDRDAAPESVAAELLIDFYRRMMAIRLFEERAEKMHTDGHVQGPFHSAAGQEGVAVGVCAALRRDDVITSTHRGHGHLIGKGADIGRMCAELNGASAGYCVGLGGSMHISDMDIGAIGENGIVGSSLFLATGAALGFQHLGQDRVAVAFAGDGSLAQGILFECMTLAALWCLPVVFVVEDNRYAHSFPSRRLALVSRQDPWWEHFGFAGARCDGTDVVQVFREAEKAVSRARERTGPSLLHVECFRWRGHNLNDADRLYRTREEVVAGRELDPIAALRDQLERSHSAVDLAAVDSEVATELDAGWAFALRSPRPDAAAVFEGVPG